MSFTRFTFVRHGETEWNLQRRVMGHQDSALTPMGIAQTRRLAERLGPVHFDAIYSSDLRRAVATAEILVENRSPGELRIDARLRERCMGIFEGRTAAEARDLYPAEWQCNSRRDEDYALPNGESPRQIVARVGEVLTALATAHAGGHVLVVTHGGFLTALFQYVFGGSYADAQRAHRPNAGINVFVCEDSRWTMNTWGDVAHLEGLRALDDPINQPAG
jgi:probable phosphoglycerate mutase